MHPLSANAYQRPRNRPTRLPWPAQQVTRATRSMTAQQMTGRAVVQGHAGSAVNNLNLTDHGSRLEVATFLKLAITQGWVDSDLVKGAMADHGAIKTVLTMAASGMTQALNAITAGWRNADWCQWGQEAIEFLTFGITASDTGLEWVIDKEAGVTLYQVAINLQEPNPVDDLYALLVFWLRHKVNGGFAHDWIADPELVDTIEALSAKARAALLSIESDDDVEAFSKRFSHAANTLADSGFDVVDNRAHIKAACEAIRWRQSSLFKLAGGMAPAALFALIREKAAALADADQHTTKGRLLLAMLNCWHHELVSAPSLQALSSAAVGMTEDWDEDERDWRLDSAVLILLDTALPDDINDELTQHHEHLMSVGCAIRERLTPSLASWHAVQAAALAEYQLGALCRWLNQE